MKGDLFGFLRNLFTKQERVTSATEPPELFVVAKFLASTPGTLPLARLCTYWAGRLPPWAVAALLYHAAPKLRAAPRLYWKKPAREAPAADKALVEAVARALGYSMQVAEQAILLLQRGGVDVPALFGRKDDR